MVWAVILDGKYIIATGTLTQCGDFIEDGPIKSKFLSIRKEQKENIPSEAIRLKRS